MGSVAAIFGALIQASSYSVAQLLVGRLLTGIAISSISYSVPMYLNECGGWIHDRGPAHAVNAVFLLGGVPLAYGVDYGFVQWDASASWRIFVALQAFFAVTAASIIWFLPDTPHWYYAGGRTEEDKEAFARHGDDLVDAPEVLKIKRHIMVAMELNQELVAVCAGINSLDLVLRIILNSKSFAV